MTEAGLLANAHVLVVANSETTLTVLMDHLSRRGRQVAVAHHAAEVLRHSADRQWDAVIIDLTPLDAALELVRQLHEHQPALATIVLGTEHRTDSIRAVREAGAYSWLPAPCSIELIDLAVAQARERRLLQRGAAQAQPSTSFPGKAVHTINNHLAGIIGLTQLHVDDDALSPDLQADLELILNSARMISNLLKPLRND